MVQQMIVSEISNQLSLTVSIVTLMFTLYHYKHYKKLIFIPFMMALSSVTFCVIDETINNILYDITYLSVAIGLIFSRVDHSISCNNCSNYSKVKR